MPGHIALAKKYAPQWRFHTSEIYWPSTVEYFLAGVKETDVKGNIVDGTVTTSNVDDAVNHGSGLYLTTDIKSGKSAFLRGQNPSTAATAAYAFIAPKDNGVVDIYYWLFTPFNEGKKVPILGEVGDHVGDWERMAVRTVNGIPTQVDYHAHSDDGSGLVPKKLPIAALTKSISTIPWAHVIKFDNNQRPVGYVAKGSHGFWATAGTFTYVDAVVFKLQDLTSDGGVYWDIRDKLVTFAYPDTFSGSLDWLNYKGYWGNIGQTNCWWYNIHKECEIVTGPDGPYRPDVLGSTKVASTATSSSKDLMKGPLSQTLGTASTEATSSYTFYLDVSAHQITSVTEYVSVAVQQTCTSIPKPARDGDQIEPTTSAITKWTGTNKFTVWHSLIAIST
ncbi:hypothetical protein C0995_012061 [Termitomyces sp. Mi166|nr:hypothetical protein C0995_012061 [Termitomyces sp. Mi166\